MSDPHEAAPEENPEDHIGEPMKDPWIDPAQIDWDIVQVMPALSPLRYKDIEGRP